MFRRKRSDTKVGSIEKTYGVDLGVRSDTKLGTLFRQTGAESVGELVRLARSPAWERAEREACARRGMQHVGGSGAPDCVGGRQVVEVKHQQLPLSAGQVREIARKPWARGRPVEVVSTSGFTQEARRAASHHGFKLRRK